MSTPHWLALLPLCNEPAGSAQQTLAWWALQFTPRVALLEDAVLLEPSASLRLFGGRRALHRRVLDEGRPLGLGAVAWAPTSLAALALARAGVVDGIRQPLPALLDALPLHVLSALRAHEPMLARLGCRHLAEVRALPRAPAARRFGDAMLAALDRAYGLAPEAHDWIVAPEQFHARLELPYRIEQAAALSHYADALLRQLCAWLAARHAGIKRLRLAWQHDAMRAREAGAGGALTLGTADGTRDFGHLSRLLAEHLAQTELQAPVGELQLHAEEIEALPERSASLLPDAPEQAREPLQQLLERIAVRLGPERVRRATLLEDHRPECMQRWQAWGQVLPGDRKGLRPAPDPQPGWLLDPPLRLNTRQDRPQYQGALQILAGPQRIEGGWWGAPTAAAAHVQRDYYLARSAEAGLLWIFLERLAADAPQHWYLHGRFA